MPCLIYSRPSVGVNGYFKTLIGAVPWTVRIGTSASRPLRAYSQLSEDREDVVHSPQFSDSLAGSNGIGVSLKAACASQRTCYLHTFMCAHDFWGQFIQILNYICPTLSRFMVWYDSAYVDTFRHSLTKFDSYISVYMDLFNVIWTFMSFT